MDEELMKRLFYFSVAVLLSIILVWFGSKLMFVSNYTISSTLYFVFGLLMFICVIYMVAAAGLVGWWMSLTVLLTGLYCLARAFGVFANPWLAHVIGFCSWIAAALLIYLAWPTRQQRFTDKDKGDRKDW